MRKSPSAFTSGVALRLGLLDFAAGVGGVRSDVEGKARRARLRLALPEQPLEEQVERPQNAAMAGG